MRKMPCIFEGCIIHAGDMPDQVTGYVISTSHNKYDAARPNYSKKYLQTAPKTKKSTKKVKK